MKYTVSDKLRPPPHCFYGDSYERGLDPWHEDAFPAEFKHAGTVGERKGGWFLLDAWKNAIGFVVDGTEIEMSTVELRKMPQDLIDAIMANGAREAVDLGIYDVCRLCDHPMSEHGKHGCAVLMDSAWTTSNTKPCGCRGEDNRKDHP